MSKNYPTLNDYLTASYVIGGESEANGVETASYNGPADRSRLLGDLRTYLTQVGHSNWTALDVRYLPLDGFMAAAFITDSGQVIISFEGTKPVFSTYGASTLAQDEAIRHNQTPSSFDDAYVFTNDILREANSLGISSKNVFLTGHSLGGAEAEYVESLSPFLSGTVFGDPGLPGYAGGSQPLDLINYVEIADPIANFSSNEQSHLGVTVVIGSSLTGISALDLLVGFFTKHELSTYAEDLNHPLPTNILMANGGYYSTGDDVNVSLVERGLYLIRDGDTESSILTFAHSVNNLAVGIAAFERINKAMLGSDRSKTELTIGSLLYVPVSATPVTTLPTVLPKLSASLTYVYDQPSGTIYTVGAALDGSNAREVIDDSTGKAVAANLISAIHDPPSTLSFALIADSGVEVDLTLDTTGGDDTFSVAGSTFHTLLPTSALVSLPTASAQQIALSFADGSSRVLTSTDYGSINSVRLPDGSSATQNSVGASGSYTLIESESYGSSGGGSFTTYYGSHGLSVTLSYVSLTYSSVFSRSPDESVSIPSGDTIPAIGYGKLSTYGDFKFSYDQANYVDSYTYYDSIGDSTEIVYSLYGYLARENVHIANGGVQFGTVFGAGAFVSFDGPNGTFVIARPDLFVGEITKAGLQDRVEFEGYDIVGQTLWANIYSSKFGYGRDYKINLMVRGDSSSSVRQVDMGVFSYQGSEVDVINEAFLQVSDAVLSGSSGSDYTSQNPPLQSFSLSVVGNTAVSGNFSTGNLTVGTATSSGGLIIAAGSTALDAGTTVLAGTLKADGVGAALNDSGVLTLGGTRTPPSTYLVNRLTVSNGAAVQAGTLTMLASDNGEDFVTVDAASTLEVGTTGGVAAGTVTIDGGASLSGVGSISAVNGIVNKGTITAQSYLALYSAVAGPGQIQIGANTFVNLASNTASTAPISFIGGNGTLEISKLLGGGGLNDQGTVSGFVTGDTILYNSAPSGAPSGLTTAVYSATGSGTGTLTLRNGSSVVGTLNLLGNYTGYGFQVTSAGNPGFYNITLVPADPLFDAAYYLAQNPDVAAAGVDPYQHYMTFGWKEGRNPSALFNTNYYLNQNPDVKAARVNPLTHFETYGWKEGRDPSVNFSTSAYLNANPDVKAAGINPLQHYETNGQFEGRAIYAAPPHATGPQDPMVDAAYVYAHNPAVAAAGLDASAWYNNVGWHQGANPNAEFDTNYYLTQNPDVKATGVNPLQHFATFGWKEGRQPSLVFDDAKYLTANPDVKAAGIDPLLHYIEFGQHEGRMTFLTGPTEPVIPLLNAAYYDQQLGATLLPAGIAAAQQASASYDQMGWKNGLNPSPNFSTNKYLAAYADVKAAGVDPLQHYIQFGQAEGRTAFTV